MRTEKYISKFKRIWTFTYSIGNKNWIPARNAKNNDILCPNCKVCLSGSQVRHLVSLNYISTLNKTYGGYDKQSLNMIPKSKKNYWKAKTKGSVSEKSISQA